MEHPFKIKLESFKTSLMFHGVSTESYDFFKLSWISFESKIENKIFFPKNFDLSMKKTVACLKL